jgi:ppGpp synthetase/RelA/SpoT-type nucleotidyltranferase
MANIKREELSGNFLEAFDKIVKLKNSDDAKQREAGLKGEKTLKKLLESKKGQAVKRVVKPKAKATPKKTKATPKKAKATPKKAKATPKKAKATPKKVSVTETNPKGLPFATRVKQRADKDGITFKEARAKLSKEIQDEKDKIEAKLREDKKKALKELEKITKAPEFQQALSQFPKKSSGKKRALKSNVSADGKRQALPRGKRISQGKGANQYGKAKKGKVYYEYRDNRSDVNSVPTKAGKYKYKGKTPPYLEAGGTLPTPFGQAGLVGETGTMNEVDLFAMGGGLPQGVHQYYGQTYNPAYPTPHGYAKGGEIKKINAILEKIEDGQIFGLSRYHNARKLKDGSYNITTSPKNEDEGDLSKGIRRKEYKDYTKFKNAVIRILKSPTSRIDSKYAKGGALNSLKKQMNDDLDIHSEYYADGGEVAKEIYDTFSEYLKVAKVGDIIWQGDNIDDFKYVSEYNVEKVVKVGQDSVFVKNIGDEDKMAYESPNENSPSSIYSLKTIVVDGTKYAKGGMIEIDEDGSNIPSKLQEVFDQFNEDEDSYKEMERLRLKAQEVGYDFDYDLSGEPTEFMKINKMAKGGRTISIVNDGVKFDKSKYKAVYGDYDKDGVVNIDDANPLDKSKSGNVEEIELKNTFDKLLGVKAELDDIMYDAVDTLDEKAPKGADIYARTKTPYSILKKLVEKRMLDPKRGLTDMIGTTIAVDNQKELVELRDKIDNGLLGKVLDRDDFYKRPNAGYRAYHYIVEYKGVPVEVQLKTKNMKKLHEVAHKSYKLGTLNPKTLNEVSIVFMKADKGDAKSKVQMEKLLSNKKQLISKISK